MNDETEEVGYLEIAGVPYRVTAKIVDEPFRQLIFSLAIRATLNHNNTATMGNGAVIVKAERCEPA